MKKTFLLLTACILMGFSLPVLAQNDSSRTNPRTKILSDSIQSDTIAIGNMLIIKKKGEQNFNDNRSRGTIAIGNVVIGKWSKDENDYYVNRNRKIRKPYNTTIDFDDKKVSLDISQSVNEDTLRLGRLEIIKSQDSNYRKDWISMIEDGDFDNTDITINRVSPENFSLNNRKSTNVNLWVVTQKLNLFQHKINLKYGLGVEMFNFRFDKSISFREDITNNVKYDVVSFTKNKLLVKYLTVPVQFNFSPNPHNKKAFYASIGMSAGYLWNAKNKQISGERGKEKFRGNFNLNDWRFATIGELGLGSLRLYGSFANANLFNKNQSLVDMQPFAVGLRFSRF